MAQAVAAGEKPASQARVQALSQVKMQQAFRQQPLAFEPNVGQADADVQFIAHAGNVDVALGGSEITFIVRERNEADARVDRREARHAREGDGLLAPLEVSTIRMKLVGGTLLRGAAAGEELPGRANFFLGSDPQNWRRDVPRYARVVYPEVYPGVALAFYGSQGQAEYDFAVAPGADPRGIELGFEGPEEINLSPQGDLVLKTKRGELLHKRAFVYQERDGKREPVPCRYVVKGEGRVGFDVGSYDRQRPLVIDPTVIYKTPVEIGGRDIAYFAMGGPPSGPIAVTPGGSAYIAYVVLMGGSDPYHNPDAVVAKLDDKGNVLTTIQWGGSKRDGLSGIAVDAQGNVYIAGDTWSEEIPLGVRPPFQAVHVKGSDTTGYGWSDGYVAEFDPSLSALLYSTYLGGSGRDFLNALAVTPAGEVVVTGRTASMDFPTAAAFQPAIRDPDPAGYVGGDAFLTKFNAEGSGLVYSTFLGSNGLDWATSLALDPMGNAHIAGEVFDWYFGVDFNLKGGLGLSPRYTFLAKFDPSGQCIYSTYFGAPAYYTDPQYVELAGDAQGRTYVVGETETSDTSLGSFTTTPDALQPNPGRSDNCPYPTPRSECADGFLTRLSADGATLEYSTYLGGSSFDFAWPIVLDELGYAYLDVYSKSPDFLGSGRTVGTDYLLRLSPQGTFQKADGSLDPKTYAKFLSNTEFRYFAIDASHAAYVDGYTALGSFVMKIRGDEQKLDVLPEGCSGGTCQGTTRWKPQRDTTKDIDVVFTGPQNLGDPNVTKSVTLEITDPSGLPVSNPTLSALTAVDNSTDPARWKITWAGAWTAKDSNGNDIPIPAGDYKVLVKATRQDDSTIDSKDDPDGKVSLVEVKAIHLLQCGTISGVTCQDGGARLDVNTGPGGGEAAFPDATAQAGALQRTVLIKADLSPDLGQDASQVAVYFGAIDVDDPSASAAGSPIDDDTMATSSTDNKNEGAELVTSATASPDLGGAVSYFRVSTQQGNNYRLMASTFQPWLSRLCGVVSSQSGEVQHAPCSPGVAAVPLPDDESRQVSDMLTVWRTLHVERTRMDSGSVTQTNLRLNGTWTGIGRRKLEDKAASPFYTWRTADGVPDHTTRNQWEGGSVNPYAPAGQDFAVKGNNDRTVNTSSGDMRPIANPSDPNYYLQDDLWSSLAFLNHDTSMLARILAGDYIKVEETDSAPVPFVHNLSNTAQNAMHGAFTNSSSYWNVPLLLAFEAERENDNDPTGDAGPTNGRCSLGDQPLAAVFTECIRDFQAGVKCPNISPTIPLADIYTSNEAHEVLHALTLDHDGDQTGGIMCSAIKNYANEPHRFEITVAQKARLRALQVPHRPSGVTELSSCVSRACH